MVNAVDAVATPPATGRPRPSRHRRCDEQVDLTGVTRLRVQRALSSQRSEQHFLPPLST